MSYPILLDMRGRRVVVIGGGKVAARKVIDLVAAGAQVMLFSPTLHPDLVALGDQIEVYESTYRPGTLMNMVHLIQWDMILFMVFAATDSRKVNQQVANEAREIGILVNVADEGESGDFSTMATVKRDKITIAISTGGASPALSAHLREKLEAEIGAEYATLARWLGEIRPRVRKQVKPEARRRDLWQAILASPALDRLRSGDEAGARAMIDALVATAIEESETPE